jgi:hypothetical protein
MQKKLRVKLPESTVYSKLIKALLDADLRESWTLVIRQVIGTFTRRPRF